MKTDEVPCNPHPCAPHGFNRNASHNAHRYVCDCEGWEPEQTAMTGVDVEALRALLFAREDAMTTTANENALFALADWATEHGPALLAKSASYDALVARVAAAPVGTVVTGRANSYGGYHVEIAHDQGWASGQRVRQRL